MKPTTTDGADTTDRLTGFTPLLPGSGFLLR